MKPWPHGTVIEAIEDTVLWDSDWQGNRTVILKGARGEVSKRIWFDHRQVRHATGATVYDMPGFWRDYQDKFRVVA